MGQANSIEARGRLEAIELLKDLARDFRDSYNERGELHLTNSGLMGIVRKFDLIIAEMERGG